MAPKKMPKEYAPVKFGEPFNPDSVEGQELKRRRAKFAQRRQEREAEEAELVALADAREAELNKRSLLGRWWDRLRG